MAKKKEVQRVLILEDTKTDYIIVFAYGDGTACVASTYYNENGYLCSEYYQDRIDNTFKDLWSDLAEGKQYMTDWDGGSAEHPHKEEVDEQVIKDAIAWLCLGGGKAKRTFKAKGQWKNLTKEIKNFLKQA